MNKIKTKIVATIGPSSWDPNVMKKMIETGMNVARVNGAFADTAELDKVTKLVRDVSDNVGLMMDVKGPEVRMNKFAEAKQIEPGMIIEIGNDESSEIYPGNYKDLYQNLKPGQRIVIGDGDVEMVLKEIKGDKMITEVVFGELLKPGKAMNLPGADFATSALTEKDLVNLKHSLDLKWDYVSASFIQNAQSAKDVKAFLKDSNMKLIAKIEDQQGVDNITEILHVVDGIMVARGGLGVELGLEKVPAVQRHLIEAANKVGKPVITATQMLESMITNPRPTRAEANDVANAILTGSDSVMLSGESSAGKFPIEAIEWLVKIAEATENQLRFHEYGNNMIEVINANLDYKNDLAKSAITIAEAAAFGSRNLSIKAFFVLTKHGFSARMLSRYKISQPIYAFVPDEYVKRSLLLTGGVEAEVFPASEADRDSLIRSAVAQAKSKGLVQTGDLIGIVIGSQVFSGTNASSLELQTVS
jgi:pyruvate kinase